MILDHIGIAVKDLDAAIRRYETDFKCKVELRESISEHKIEAAFIKLDNSSIELISPSDSSSIVTKFLSERGEGLHHVCYEVSDIKSELSRLDSLGYRLVDTSPRKGARNRLIAFIHPQSVDGVLTELCQKI